MTDGQPHRTTVRVRYEETDQMGVVYHANYLRYFEIGRTEMLRSRGASYRELEERGIFLAVVSLDCRYHASARYDDVLAIETRLEEVGKARVCFAYEIARDAERVVSGCTWLACLGADRRPRRFPSELAELLER